MAVDLEYGLREIKTDRGNFAHRTAPSWRFLNSNRNMAHRDAGGGSRPQHHQQNQGLNEIKSPGAFRAPETL